MQLSRIQAKALAGLSLALAGFLLGVVLITLSRGEDRTALAHFPPNTGTATSQTPATPHSNLDLAIGVDFTHPNDTNSANDDCISQGIGSAGVSGGTNVCNVPPDSNFTLNIYILNNGGIATYRGFDIGLTYSDVTSKNNGDPDPACDFAPFSYSAGNADFACGIVTPIATTAGRIATIDFNCADSTSGTITLVHGLNDTDIIDTNLDGHSEIDGSSEALSITCVGPTPTSTASPTSTPTNTPTLTSTPTATSTPTFTNTPSGSVTPTATLTATPTQTFFPAISLDASGDRVTCHGTPSNPTSCDAPFDATPGTPFQLDVRTNRIPGGGYGGFNSEVLFGGLTLNNRSCLQEVIWPDSFLCQQIKVLAAPPVKAHKSRSGLFPPFALSSYQDVLVEMNITCPREGQFKVVLPVFDPTGRTNGAAYVDAAGNPTPVATVGSQQLDLTGDTIADTTPSAPLADVLLVNCQIISTATPTGTPTVTATPTATPCPTGGCPTSTPTRTNTPSVTPTATNTLPPPNTPIPSNTPTRTNTPTSTSTPPPCCEFVNDDDVARGGKITTDTENGGDGATSSDTVETSVQIPLEGAVSIGEKQITQPDPTGFHLLGQQVNISAPNGNAQQPIVIIFWLDHTLLTGISPSTVQVFKNGALVPNCTGGAGIASPDPCVGKRNVLTGDANHAGDLEIIVFSSDASAWNFGVSSTAATLIGDVNCDGVINPIDAAVLLQFIAGIINSLPCPQNADVNQNGAANASDASLILQFSADIIHTLPPNAAGLQVWPGAERLKIWLAGLRSSRQ